MNKNRMIISWLDSVDKGPSARIVGFKVNMTRFAQKGRGEVRQRLIGSAEEHESP